ncbi:protein AMBP-like [Syngnathoides biaculeatus]|uniref:protein AMBP-like n=1 Tax=Syngnathoides biaculeatus TaxID=300417 RepID=UPI002ADE0247|nr:protein AMBP-like [Syngnathoides biaculeatus]
MKGIWSLLLLFTFDGILHGERGFVPQENFDLDRFLGKWYEVAVVSDCPHYMQNKQRNAVIVALDLKPSAEGNVTVMAAAPRNGSCKQTSIQYALTDIAGQFFYHVSRLNVDVDAYVVRTDYDHSAVMALVSTEKTSKNRTTIFKLYNRSSDVRYAELDDFKMLVRLNAMKDDIIIVHEDKSCNTKET